MESNNLNQKVAIERMTFEQILELLQQIKSCHTKLENAVDSAIKRLSKAEQQNTLHN